MKLTLLTLCDQAIISNKNKLNIIGIIDKLFVKKIPGFYSSVHIAGVCLGKSNKVYSLDLVVTDPKSTELVRRKVTIKTGLSGKANMTINLRNLKLLSTGEHTLDFLYNKKSLGELKFQVILATNTKIKKINKKNYLPN